METFQLAIDQSFNIYWVSAKKQLERPPWACDGNMQAFWVQGTFLSQLVDDLGIRKSYLQDGSIDDQHVDMPFCSFGWWKWNKNCKMTKEYDKRAKISPFQFISHFNMGPQPPSFHKANGKGMSRYFHQSVPVINIPWSIFLAKGRVASLVELDFCKRRIGGSRYIIQL